MARLLCAVCVDIVMSEKTAGDVECVDRFTGELRDTDNRYSRTRVLEEAVASVDGTDDVWRGKANFQWFPMYAHTMVAGELRCALHYDAKGRV